MPQPPHSRSLPFHRAALAPSLVALLASLAPAMPAGAATILVTTRADESPTDPDNGLCSLREALHAANNDFAVDSCAAGDSDDTIQLLPTGTYTFDEGHGFFGNGTVTIDGLGSTGDRVISLGFANRFLTVQGGSVTVKDVTVTLGVAGSDTGGAFRVLGGGLTLRRVDLSLNQASWGGAVAFEPGSAGTALVIEDSNFGPNAATGFGRTDALGGAIYASITSGTSVTIRDSTFGGNSATEPDSGRGLGGGVSLTGDNASSFLLERCRFEGNSSEGESSGYGGGLRIRLSGAASATLRDLEILDNEGDIGSGLHYYLQHEESVLTIDRAIFRSNPRPAGGGGFQLEGTQNDTSTVVLHNLVVDGTAPAAAGGVRSVVAANTAYDLAHATVVGHTEEGISVGVNGGAAADARVRNVISWDNGQDLDLVPSIVAGPVLSTDPHFVDAANGDYRLEATSPAIDAGQTLALPAVGDVDIEGWERVQGLAPDIGAHEWGGIFKDGFESGDTSAWSG